MVNMFDNLCGNMDAVQVIRHYGSEILGALSRVSLPRLPVWSAPLGLAHPLLLKI